MSNIDWTEWNIIDEFTYRVKGLGPIQIVIGKASKVFTIYFE